MTSLTNILVAHFVGGTAFFTGLAMTSLAMTVKYHVGKPLARSVVTIFATTGAVFVACSATPFPIWAYAVWFVFLVAAWAASSWKAKYKLIALGLLIFASTAMATMEIPYHLTPKMDIAGRETLFVVGDSLSMGADPPGMNWPELLGEKMGLPTRNLSFGGAMLDSAMNNAEKIKGNNALVILEIGGNDLLRNRDDFEANLKRLLEIVNKPQNKVVMLELPLPPSYNAYGQAQRKLSRAFGVTLVPKRYLASVLTAPGATVDGLHLSNKGHELMAAKLHGIFSE